MKKVGIINLDSGNLLSIQTAVEKIGFNPLLINRPNQDLDALILPGQGRFASITSQLDKNNWRDFLTQWVYENKTLIGICVGMQVLFESSSEDPKAKGLGLLSGKVEKLNHPKTPMVGWAQLNSKQYLLKNQYAYFVNSYGVMESPYCTSKVGYGSEFCASVQKENLYGFQFHPEKSAQFGRRLIQSCL